jgi:protein-tyrosine-phosphatase
MTSSPQLTRAALPERALVALARLLEPAIERVLRVGWVRRRLHTRALAAWRSSPEPLILCYGNINRSPFAAELARARSSSEPTSSGFYPTPGRAASEQALRQARLYGVDLSSHRSTLVTAEQLRRAGAIFLFDLENVARLAWREPRALRTANLLGALLTDGPVIIVDPHGRGEQAMSDTFARISQVLGALGAARSESS